MTTSVFLIEFADLLESTILCTDQLLITGDFNFHVGVIGNSDARRFHKLVDRAGLDQHVRVLNNAPTLVATPLILSLPEILIS